MRKLYIIIGILMVALGLQAQDKETPNAKQARRMFMEIGRASCRERVFMMV